MSLMRRKCCCDCWGTSGKGCTTNLFSGTGCPTSTSDCTSERSKIDENDFPATIDLQFTRNWMSSWSITNDMSTTACTTLEPDCNYWCLRCPDHDCTSEDGFTLWDGMQEGDQDYSLTLTRQGCDSGTDCCSMDYVGTYTRSLPSSWTPMADIPGGAESYDSVTESTIPDIEVTATISVGYIPYGRSQYQLVAKVYVFERSWIIYGPVTDSCGACCFPVQTGPLTPVPYDFGTNSTTTHPGAEDDWPSPSSSFDLDPLGCDYDATTCPLCECKRGWFDSTPTYHTTDCGFTSVHMKRWVSADFTGLDTINWSRKGDECGQFPDQSDSSSLYYSDYLLVAEGLWSVGPTGSCIYATQVVGSKNSDWSGPDSDVTRPDGFAVFVAVVGREHSVSMTVNF